MPPSICSTLFKLLAVSSIVSSPSSLLARADPQVFQPKDADEYDKGSMGLYPEVKFKTSDLVSPHVLRRQWEPECDKADLNYLFCPRGMLVSHPGPMILDKHGHMVWTDETWPISYGLTVQEYKKEKYLTFWYGNDQVIGHGQGHYFMLDKNYKLFKKVSALNNITGDLHEFKITRDNTALLTSYLSVPWDLSKENDGKGPSNGFIWDCFFQEIDIETNELLFQWRATDHFTFNDCYNPLRTAGASNNPWDWYHINSVEKDKRGNYLISSRYSHSLTYINGRTGESIWHLGGKNNSFEDLSDGEATGFAWQHDARWIEEFKSVSIFDNAAYFADQTHGARGLKLELDLDRKTVRLLTKAQHPRKYISESQGSAQVLPNGNMFLGYGSAAAFTEFDREGNVMCDQQFGALHYHKDGTFSPSTVMSYRAYRHEWHGYPLWDPKIKFESGRFYVSWNGATEYRKWMLEGTNRHGTKESDWEEVSTFDRAGFESDCVVDEKAHQIYRLTAFDKENKRLGMWLVYSAGEVKAIPYPEPPLNPLFYVLAGVFMTLGFMYFFRRRSDLYTHIRRYAPASTHGYLPLHNTGSSAYAMNGNPIGGEVPNGSAKLQLTKEEEQIAAFVSPTKREF